MSRDVTLYVNDMIEACRRVVEYSEGIDRERLQADSMRNDAIVRNLEILGEAAKAVPPDVRALEPEIAWRRVAGLRDVLAHAYFAIDRDIVWNVISAEVPALLPRLSSLLSELTPKEGDGTPKD